MSRTVYVNGEFLPEEDAKISIFDRGFLFADGVYEVCSVLGGKLIDNQAHLTRLKRSLNELSMGCPSTEDEIVEIQQNLIEANNIDEGLVYLQVSRGAADREFPFPEDAIPSLVMFTQSKNLSKNPRAETGISVITLEDIRWKRRDIKTVGLLGPCMAKQQAMDAGADDAWMVEDGFITEGTSSNAYIVTHDDKIITRHLSNEILHGITRKAILKLAAEHNLEVEERPFTVEEAEGAKEAFFTSASAFVLPVVSINKKLLGNGGPGILTSRLRELYLQAATG